MHNAASSPQGTPPAGHAAPMAASPPAGDPSVILDRQPSAQLQTPHAPPLLASLQSTPPLSPEASTMFTQQNYRDVSASAALVWPSYHSFSP